MRPEMSDILAARAVLRGRADATPMVPSPLLSGLLGTEAFLKLEIAQPIGAFKLRGAMNAIMALPDDVAGVTCCSTGNHGRGVAYAAREHGLRAVICMSTLVPDAKVAGIRALGAEVRIEGQSQDDAQRACTRLCQTEGLAEIPPFDDPKVIAGQGTIGLEILEARPDLEMLLVPLSGGGLAAGVALAAKTLSPRLRVIGITMDRGAAMHLSLQAGHPVEVDEVPSLADSLGGGIGASNRFTLGMCRDLLDGSVLVTEEDIYRAMQALYFEDRIVAEGGSVVGIAAAMAGKLPAPAGPVATILTGRNLDMDLFTKIINGEAVVLGDRRIEGHRHDP
ncbi:threonine dehydratase [Aliiruegeria haliotis]|uniref:Threonine dehydratase n=1 Tax=Aliiruegeria haliotis TaxID=1280846 RepID=A0A2T0RN36_9RHOB|nr:hydroxyectoine utilization dehydratase EutB [Aliiruegeria haliotis]PRY22568.1 threonine dehydratase [Aliiruegeria haliotis]